MLKVCKYRNCDVVFDTSIDGYTNKREYCKQLHRTNEHTYRLRNNESLDIYSDEVSEHDQKLIDEYLDKERKSFRKRLYDRRYHNKKKLKEEATEILKYLLDNYKEDE